MNLASFTRILSFRFVRMLEIGDQDFLEQRTINKYKHLQRQNIDNWSDARYPEVSMKMAHNTAVTTIGILGLSLVFLICEKMCKMSWVSILNRMKCRLSVVRSTVRKQMKTFNENFINTNRNYLESSYKNVKNKVDQLLRNISDLKK